MIESIWFGDRRIEVNEFFITPHDKNNYVITEISKKSIKEIESINQLFIFESCIYDLKKLKLKSFFEAVFRNLEQFFKLLFSKEAKYFFLLKKNSDREYYRIIYKQKDCKPFDFWIYDHESETFDNAYGNYYPDSVTKFWK